MHMNKFRRIIISKTYQNILINDDKTGESNCRQLIRNSGEILGRYESNHAAPGMVDVLKADSRTFKINLTLGFDLNRLCCQHIFIRHCLYKAPCMLK